MNVPNLSYRAWIAKAGSDVLTIKLISEASAVPWDAVCFHAQQAAEKYLKALLAARGQEPPRSHDLRALFRACQEIDPTLPDVEADCVLRTPYVAASRYPGILPEPDRDTGERAIAAMDRILEAISQRLPGTQP